MNYRECPHPGPTRRGLPLVLFVALLLSATVLTTVGCRNPDKAKAEHITAGEAFLKDKKYQEASLEFRNAIQIDDRLAAAHWGLARAYEGLGLEQFQQTLAELRRTVELDPNNLDARVRLGNIYIAFFQRDKDNKLKDEAVRLADEVLARDPKHIEAHILKGTILYTTGDRAGALTELNRAVELDPRRVESLMSLALYHRFVGDTAKAEATYQSALQIDPRSALVHTQYGQFLAQQRQNDRAEAEFKKAVESDPSDRGARRTLAGFYFANKQLDKAEAAYKELAELDGGKPEGRAALAEFYVLVNRPDDAAKLYQDIIAKSPEYTQARYSLAELQLQRGDVAGAAAQAEGVLKQNQNDLQARLLRARTRLQQDNPKAAIEDLKEVLKQDPQNRFGLYFMADANSRAGQLDQARVFASELEKNYPNYLAAKLMQAQLNLASGDLPATQRLSTDLLARLNSATPGPDAPPQALAEMRSKALATRGASYLQARPPNAAAARADFSAARDADPNSPSSYSNLAAVAIVENKPDEAQSLYERALQIDNANFDALNGLVNLYARRKQFDQAHARIDQAIAARPDSAGLHFIKAQVFGLQQDPTATETELRRTLELDPSYLTALRSLGALYVNTKQFDRAIAEYQKILEKHPDDANAFLMIGMVEDGRGNRDAAADAYRRALGVNPRADFAANNLAWLAAEYGKGNLDEAVRLAQEVVQRNLDTPAFPGYADTLGWVYYKKGLYPAAVEQLQKAVAKASALGNDSTLYRYHLGRALAGAGRKAEARQQLQQALNTTKGNVLSAEQADEARRTLTTL